MYIRSGEWVIILKASNRWIYKGIKSLWLRIICIMIIVGVIPCVIMKWIVVENYEKRAVEVRTAEIQNQCTILCNALGNFADLEEGTSELIRTELRQLSSIYSGRVMLIDAGYTIVEDTYNLDLGKTIVSENVIRAFKGKSGVQYDEKNCYIEVTMPIVFEQTGNLTGAILVSVSTDSIIATAEVLEEKANLVQSAIILFLILIAMFSGFMLSKPFARMTKSINSIAEGIDDHELQETSYTETMQISDAFNKMLYRQKILNDSRQEFVANVSHELKTPLTSMKILADSLLEQTDAPVELYQEFMGDLSHEIERENKIINDLLSLVKLDKTAATLQIQIENINELVELNLKRLRPIAMKENVELIYESFRPVHAEIDAVKMSLVITNLVENAIKYNKENGWVHVSLNADHKYFYLEVADSGIGIPENETEHIFERFYRVDKSHSREIGGTGLGLAIARNAVVMHRGSIKVFSQEGEGTTFTVKIPISYIGGDNR